ncbi:hypothetical protein QJQ45_028591, partial [Haematococcus lacustris]
SAVADALLAAQHALALLLVHYCQTLQHALITAQAQAQLNSLQHIGLGAAQLEDTLTEMAAERSRLLQQIASQRSDIQHLFNMLALSNSAVEGVNDTVEAVLAGMQEEGQGAGAAAAAGAAAGDVEGVGGGMAGVLGGLLGLGLVAPSGQQGAASNDSSQTSSSSCSSSSQPPPLPPDSASPPNAPQGEAPTAYLAASSSSSGSSQCRQGAVPPEDTGEQSVVGQSPAGGPQASGALVSRVKGDPGQWGGLGAGPRTPRLTLAATAAAGAACVLAAAGASSSPAAAGLAQALLQASGGVLAAGTPRGPGSSCLQEAGRESAVAGSDPTGAGRVVGEGEEGEVTARVGGHSAISAGPAAACLMQSSNETVDEAQLGVVVEGAVEDPVGSCAGASAGRVPLQQQVAGSNPDSSCAPQPGQQVHHSDYIMQRLIDSDFAPGFENLLKQQQQQQQQQLGGAVGMPAAAAAAIDPPLQQHRVVEGGGCMARGVGVGAGQRSLASAVEVSLQGLLEGYAELDQALSSVFSGTFGAVRAMLRCSFTSLALATALFLTAGQAAMGVKAGGQGPGPQAQGNRQPAAFHPAGPTGIHCECQCTSLAHL